MEELINKWHDEGKVTFKVSNSAPRAPQIFPSSNGNSGVPVKVYTPERRMDAPKSNFQNNNNNNTTIINNINNKSSVEVPVNKKPESKPAPKVLPEMEKEEGDDFLPLKEFVKKATVEPKVKVENTENKNNNRDTSGLKSALDSLLKKVQINPEPVKQKEPVKEEPIIKVEPKSEIKVEEKKSENIPNEIPEKDLKKILGIEE